MNDLTYEKIRSTILKEIKPTDAEVKSNIARINMVMGRLKKITGREVELRVAGSVARGTDLKGTADVDIFMLFNKNVPRDVLVKKGLSFGKKLAKGKGSRYEIKYAEHPYVRLFLNDLAVKVDLVPALKIDNIDEMATMVDRTPLHTEFVNTRFTNKQRDDTRLLKYLLKSNGIYGAEVKTSGFSGYLCELLIYHFGSLHEVLKSFTSIKLPLIIDPKMKAAVKDDKLVKKFNTNFIVIDPVDYNRNVAAGVSVESLAKFVFVARHFAKKPSVEIFYGKRFKHGDERKYIKNLMEKSGLDFFFIELNVPDKSEDITWPQLRKTSEILDDQITRLGFTTYLSVPVIKESKGLLLLIAPRYLLNSRLLKGPNTFIEPAVSNFVDSHSDSLGFVVKGESIFSLEPGKYSTLESVLRDVLKGKVIKKHKDINLSKAKLYVNSIPKNYEEAIYLELLKKLLDLKY